MNAVALTINGEKHAVAIEPRTSLADVVRETLNLTGTHLGCEQGVCGACTILVDGVPVRSCIGNATACDGASVRTIEDFDADPVMSELRAAFNLHHGLQCGFCTPGMLIMARDIVLRLPDADEPRIRIELAGNLCRCTGYSGIVKAIRSVIVARQGRGESADAAPQSLPLGPAGSGHARTGAESTGGFGAPVRAARPAAAPVTQKPSPAQPLSGAAKRTPAVKQSFTVAAEPQTVWERFGDVPAMVRCIPGASLVSEDADGTYAINMRIKMGPVGADFAGTASQRRDDATMTGVILGAGRDTKSASLAEGELTYRINPEGEGTRVDIEVGYALSGALAQFARGGIVTHFIGAVTSQFAANLERVLAAGTDGGEIEQASELKVAGSLGAALKAWLGDLLRAPFRRK
jgi:carbon-monoxide dehydrogenase small subunit